MNEKFSDVQIGESVYRRIPIKTNIINKGDSLDYLLIHSLDYIKTGDVLFISEKVVSIMQSRIINLNDIKPGFLANTLSKYVSNTPGANLNNPKSMQVAIDQTGMFRILLASALSALTKPFGLKGVFYKVAGDGVRGIDFPSDNTVEGFDKYISLTPKNPDKVAYDAQEYTGISCCILDANYRGINILASSDKELDEDLYRKILKDNPMGQNDEQTPLCIVRQLE